MLARAMRVLNSVHSSGRWAPGLPLAKAVAVAEDALLGARLFLVAARAADQCVEAKFFDGSSSVTDWCALRDLAPGCERRTVPRPWSLRRCAR